MAPDVKDVVRLEAASTRRNPFQCMGVAGDF